MFKPYFLGKGDMLVSTLVAPSMIIPVGRSTIVSHSQATFFVLFGEGETITKLNKNEKAVWLRETTGVPGSGL